MKKILYIFLSACLLGLNSSAQDERGDKIREKMVEYIQNKLGLTKTEAEKFQPIFLDYLREKKNTMDQFKRDDDKLELQKKIVDLRIRYRDQFKTIVGEKRSNDVYLHEREFIEKAKTELIDRLENRKEGRPNKKTGFLH